MNSVSQPFSLWLVPEKRDSDLLSGLIDTLSRQYNSIPFQPHLTVVSGRYSDLNGIKEQTIKVAEEFSTIRVTIKNISFSEHFFKTLYIEFEKSELLNNLFQIAKAIIKESYTKAFYPHASLLYKDMNINRKKELAHRVNLEMNNINFDKLEIVSPQNKEKEWHDISTWKMLFEKKLGI